MDKIRVEKEDITPKQRITMKSIEEIIKELTPIEKVQTLISRIDTPKGQEKISQGYNPLGSTLKRRLPNLQQE